MPSTHAAAPREKVCCKYTGASHHMPLAVGALPQNEGGRFLGGISNRKPHCWAPPEKQKNRNVSERRAACTAASHIKTVGSPKRYKPPKLAPRVLTGHLRTSMIPHYASTPHTKYCLLAAVRGRFGTNTNFDKGDCSTVLIFSGCLS